MSGRKEKLKRRASGVSIDVRRGHREFERTIVIADDRRAHRAVKGIQRRRFVFAAIVSVMIAVAVTLWIRVLG